MKNSIPVLIVLALLSWMAIVGETPWDGAMREAWAEVSFLEAGISPADQATIYAALHYVQQTEAQDASLQARIAGTLRSMDAGIPFGPKDHGIIGFALSRASADPAACDLLHRIDPTAVCVK